jgi:hypothetical protein
MIEHAGEKKSLAEWARRLGYTDGGKLLWWRIKEWGLEDAFSEPLPNTGITYQGRNQSLSQWAKELGCDRATMDNRVHKWGVDRAFSTPVRIFEQHGMSKTPEYRIWSAMLTRCSNKNHPQFDDYGGRGIKVCARWRNSFQAFIDDMGRRPDKKLTLDRENNDGDYTPDNCHWVTRQRNQSNMRSNINITYKDETRNQSEWARRLGISASALNYRIRKFGVDEAMTKPINIIKRKHKR